MGPQAAAPAVEVSRRRPGVVRFGGRRAARRTADVLDGLVDTEVEFLRALPVHLRTRPAEVLAQLATLATDHRYRARGVIGRRELRRRIDHAVAEIDRVAENPARTGR